jgi:hypothetical protein
MQGGSQASIQGCPLRGSSQAKVPRPEGMDWPAKGGGSLRPPGGAKGRGSLPLAGWARAWLAAKCSRRRDAGWVGAASDAGGRCLGGRRGGVGSTSRAPRVRRGRGLSEGAGWGVVLLALSLCSGAKKRGRGPRPAEGLGKGGRAVQSSAMRRCYSVRPRARAPWEVRRRPYSDSAARLRPAAASPPAPPPAPSVCSRTVSATPDSWSPSFTTIAARGCTAMRRAPVVAAR